MPGDCDYKWHWARLGQMLLNGEHLFAVVQAGGKDISTVNEGVSVLWQVCAPVEGGSMTDCRARGEIKFTSFETTEAEFATAKRLAKSTLNALEKAFT